MKKKIKVIKVIKKKEDKFQNHKTKKNYYYKYKLAKVNTQL